MTIRVAAFPAALVALTLAGSLLGSPAVAADTAEDARARATAAAREVDALAPRVALALASYEQALDGLAADVTSGISAEEAAADARAAHDVASRAVGMRVRALYMSGGETGLLATVLDASSPADLARRIGAFQRVVQTDEDRAGVTGTRLDAASALALRLAARSDRRTATVGDVAERLRVLNDLLDEAQRTLDALDKEAGQLEEAEAAAAAVAAARQAADSARWSTVATAKARGIPVDFLGFYRAAAATCSNLPWPVLAAIGQVESGHGSNPHDSPAGAQGPMQFLPSTFAAYAVDGDQDGVADIRNPADAIFSAAKYLCANGAGVSAGALRRAIYRYNHAQWYVALVLRVAAQIAERFSEPPVPPYEPVSP